MTRGSNLFYSSIAVAAFAGSSSVLAFAPSSQQTRNAYHRVQSPKTLAPFLAVNDGSDEDILGQFILPDTRKDESKSLLNPTQAKDLVNIDNEKEIDVKKNGPKLATAALAMALAFMPLNNADAAMSGGRMGGSFSAPRPSISRSAPSSYSRGYSSGFSSGYMSRPGVTISPGFGYGYGYSPFISPFAPVTPFFGGGVALRGPSIFDLFFPAFFLFTAAQILLRTTRGFTSSGLEWTSSASTALGPGTSVAQLSVALEVPDRDDPNSILGVLNRLAQTARTDSRVGVQNLSSQVAVELLRRRSSIVSASSSYKHFSDRNKALREFQSRSVKERSKFESEAVSKYGGVDYGTYRSGQSPSSSENKATMAVVTLVLAIDGDSTKLPRINSIGDVDKALQKIASDSKVDDCLQSAEILWTPEDRSETLSLRDVVADYPELRSV